MNRAEFQEIVDRVEAAAATRESTGSAEQASVPLYDALLLVIENDSHRNRAAGLRTILDGAGVEPPSTDLLIHARQVVEKLFHTRYLVDQAADAERSAVRELEAAISVWEEKNAQLVKMNQSLRAQLTAAEASARGLEKALEALKAEKRATRKASK